MTSVGVENAIGIQLKIGLIMAVLPWHFRLIFIEELSLVIVNKYILTTERKPIPR